MLSPDAGQGRGVIPQCPVAEQNRAGGRIVSDEEKCSHITSHHCKKTGVKAVRSRTAWLVYIVFDCNVDDWFECLGFFTCFLALVSLKPLPQLRLDLPVKNSSVAP